MPEGEADVAAGLGVRRRPRRPALADQVDTAILTDCGITRYDGPHLTLLSDVPAERVAEMSELVTSCVAEFDRYFVGQAGGDERPEGPPSAGQPPERFKVCGYLMADPERFRKAGLLAADLPAFDHGQHRDYEFWMRDQATDYFRRHLLVHEVTHCYMTTIERVIAPDWYLEGMAEYFGTHRRRADGGWEFGVMPDSPGAFPGHGRLNFVRQATLDGRARGLGAIEQLTPDEFRRGEGYAWSWALCTFLNHHPRYREGFWQYGHEFIRSRSSSGFMELLGSDLGALEADWLWYLNELEFGYDLELAAIGERPVVDLRPEEGPQSRTVAARAGWQNMGLAVEAGQVVDITALGQFTVALATRPWISEPQGVSIRYVRGQPLGRLLALVVPQPQSIGTDLTTAEWQATLREPQPIGRQATWTVPHNGVLFLRLNDSAAALADNEGAVEVTISAQPEPK